MVCTTHRSLLSLAIIAILEHRTAHSTLHCCTAVKGHHNHHDHSHSRCKATTSPQPSDRVALSGTASEVQQSILHSISNTIDHWPCLTTMPPWYFISSSTRATTTHHHHRSAQKESVGHSFPPHSILLPCSADRTITRGFRLPRPLDSHQTRSRPPPASHWLPLAPAGSHPLASHMQTAPTHHE